MISEGVQYLNEHLWVGQLGHFLLITVFAFSLLSAFSNFKANKLDGSSWVMLGRISYSVMAVCTIAVGVLFFIILASHFTEYYYVYSNTSSTLETKFVFAAFWKDQEGSILIWMIWIAVLGLIVLFREKTYKHGVLSFLSILQALMGSMLLGLIIKDGLDPITLGIDPFRLLRDEFSAPLFSNPEYLSLIEGRGLNPSLQNYWMTIHPPTVFLGFALTTVPIAYAVAGLWRGDHENWIKPAYRWALINGTILGIGILMGSVWAYEALNFGGYWAWDPVENMSLVPWLLIVAGLHTNIISMRTKRSFQYTYLFYALAFLGVLYSTYLTKSGVLGDSSVHSFTEMGLSPQMVLTIVVFCSIFLMQLIGKRKGFPTNKTEENFWSREFWLFLGTLTLILSSALITFTTSVPVFNKIIDLFGNTLNQDLSQFHRTLPTDIEAHHNKYQLWIAILILVFSSIGTYLRWNEKESGKRLKSIGLRLAVSTILALGLALLINQWMQIIAWPYFVTLWASLFAFFSNIDLILLFGKANWKKLSTSLSHLGFAIMMVGILFSSLKKRNISQSQFMLNTTTETDEMERSVPIIKNSPFPLDDGLLVSYTDDTLINRRRYYHLQFNKMDSLFNIGDIAFETNPYVIYNQELTKIATTAPNTKHYWHKDIYTFVGYVPAEHGDIEAARAIEDSLDYQLFNMRPGDSLFTMKYVGVIGDVQPTREIEQYELNNREKAVKVDIDFFEINGNKQSKATIALILQPSGLLIPVSKKVNEAAIKLKLDESLANVVFAHEDSLTYTNHQARQQETVSFDGEEYLIVGLEDVTKEDLGDLTDDDIAIRAVIRHLKSGETIEPIFVIRDKRVIPIRDYNPFIGVSAKLISVDPSTGVFTFQFAKNDMELNNIPIRLAENVDRDDLITIVAIVFPGINLFWLGSTLMMIGFLVAYYVKRKSYSS